MPLTLTQESQHVVSYTLGDLMLLTTVIPLQRGGVELVANVCRLATSETDAKELRKFEVITSQISQKLECVPEKTRGAARWRVPEHQDWDTLHQLALGYWLRMHQVIEGEFLASFRQKVNFAT